MPLHPTPSDVGARLLAGRLAKNLTQTQLAELLDVHQSTLSRWELGATALTTAQLIVICDVLDLEPGDVLAEIAAA